MIYKDAVNQFLSKVLVIFNSNPKRREPGDGSDGYCDCIGLIIGAIRRMGLKWPGIHGSNWAARKEIIDLKSINSVSDLQVGDIVLKGRLRSNSSWKLPSRYQRGGQYYNGDLTDYYHAGVVFSVSPLQIRHMASKMTIDTELDHNKNSVWNYYGKSRQLAEVSGGAVQPTQPAQPPIPETGTQAILVAPSGSTVNLRRTPSKRGSLIKQIPLGTIVDIVSPGEEWCAVKYGKLSGYMMAEFLDIVGDGKGKY